MKVLITGGAGFIGSHLAEKLVDKGHSVYIIDNLATGDLRNLDKIRDRVTFTRDSIYSLSGDRFMKEASPDVIIHAAASYKDPSNWQEDSLTNVLGTVKTVKAALKRKVDRLIYLQTSLCYGIPKETPITLGHPIAPFNSYAITKTAAERYIANSGLDFISFRLAYCYGPRVLSGPIPLFYKNLTKNKECTVMDTKRDFVFVDTLIDILLQAIEGKGRRGYYHVSSGKDYHIKELYHNVCRALDIDRPIEIYPKGEDDIDTILLDPSVTLKDFTVGTMVSLGEGIRRAVEWYKEFGVKDTYTHLKGIRK